MNKIVECIPNFSEGRDQEKIELIVSAIASVIDVVVLDCEMDADHNRSVVTFAGEPDAVVEAALRAAATAVELIDLNQHQGVHPRIGALDVLPFTPIKGVTIDQCVVLARHAGERIAKELQIPVYLYEKAATRPSRIDLADVRRGEFEALRLEIGDDPDRLPDFGEAKIHPTAGAVAVGARHPLIAYNINLATEDLGIAKKIAKAIRGRDGGLQYIKALGVELKNRRQVQVSINLVNYSETPVFRVFEMVKREAARYGASVVGSEIVGLIPQAALNSCSDFYLQIENFSEDLVLEHRLQVELEKREKSRSALQPPLPSPAPTPAAETAETVKTDRTARAARTGSLQARETVPDDLDLRTLNGFADEISEAATTLAGGSVAAYAGALAASLGELVCNLTLGQKAAVETEVRGALKQLEQLSADLRLSVNEEEESRIRVLDAIALPRDSEAARLARTIAVEDATKSAVAAPMRVAQSSFTVLELLSELSEIGNPSAFADLAVGAQLAMAAIRGATYTVLSQLFEIKEDEFNRFRRAELSDLVTRGQEMVDEIEALFLRLYPR